MVFSLDWPEERQRRAAEFFHALACFIRRHCAGIWQKQLIQQECLSNELAHVLFDLQTYAKSLPCLDSLEHI